MGHVHLNSKDPEAQKNFWTQVMGARNAKLGPVDVYAIPGMLIFVNKKEPTAGSDGSTVNHIGLKVRDLKGALAKVQAAQFKVLSHNEEQVMLLGPDEVKVELTADPALSSEVTSHHIHFQTTEVDQMKKWYASTFSAIPGRRGKFEAADLPGINLSFTKAANPPAGTKGRAVDHIGFEVANLEAFTHKLEQAGVKFDVPYRKVERLGIAIAFFTDPWGTYIELTEGLTKAQ